MMFLGVLGDFTEAVLGLAFSFGCALLLAFVCLRFLLGLMTRQQYNVPHNVINDPSHSPFYSLARHCCCRHRQRNGA